MLYIALTKLIKKKKYATLKFFKDTIFNFDLDIISWLTIIHN